VPVEDASPSSPSTTGYHWTLPIIVQTAQSINQSIDQSRFISGNKAHITDREEKTDRTDRKKTYVHMNIKNYNNIWDKNRRTLLKHELHMR